MTRSIVKILLGTIYKPKSTFKDEKLNNSLIYSYIASFMIAIPYSIIYLIMYIKADISTYYFLFGPLIWTIFVFMIVFIVRYLTNYFGNLWSKNKSLDNDIATTNVVCLGICVPNLFILTVDFLSIVTAPNIEVTNYALGFPPNYLIPSIVSNIVFSAVGVWMTILTAYGLYKMKELNFGKTLLTTIIVLAPIVFYLIFFIYLESHQPF
ncbi:MAG: hypothetical protein ACFFCV_00625 [Promethearchaeota archaeon]